MIHLEHLHLDPEPPERILWDGCHQCVRISQGLPSSVHQLGQLDVISAVARASRYLHNDPATISSVGTLETPLLEYFATVIDVMQTLHRFGYTLERMEVV